jgi:hypothetical protein
VTDCNRQGDLLFSGRYRQRYDLRLQRSRPCSHPMLVAGVPIAAAESVFWHALINLTGRLFEWQVKEHFDSNRSGGDLHIGMMRIRFLIDPACK